MLLHRSLSLYRVESAPASRRSLTRTAVTVGIRREDPQRIWERRAPLSPKAVKELVEGGINVEFEHCDRRVFRDDEYIAVGAKVKPNLQNAHIIIGIKETPLNEVIQSAVPALPGSYLHRMGYAMVPRTHLMFSHTAKGQPYNTPLLAKYVGEPGDQYAQLYPRLIDYELLTDEKSGKRTVGFGWFAGVAGVLESLSSMAHSHLENGIATPFLSTPRPHTHPTLQSIRSALKTIAERIKQGGISPALGPFVIGLTGTGNVSQGCLDILSELPIEKVEVSDLHALVTNPNTPLNKVYLVHALPKDYFVRLDGQPYERSDYYARPQSYRSIFCETVAPYLTLFLNGTGWSTNFPRLMTNEQLSVALDRARAFGGARFTNIGDISCDIEGGLQFLTRATTLSSPFYKISPPPVPASSALPSVQMMSVDILPASLPLDASYHFSRELFPYVESLVREYQTGATDTFSKALDRATIAEGGRLVEKHKGLMGAVASFYKTGKVSTEPPVLYSKESLPKPPVRVEGRTLRKKKILMLGSGMVAGPAVELIAKRQDVQLVVAGNALLELEKLASEHLNIQYRVIDMQDQKVIASLIEESDIVISLLPASFHVDVAQQCIRSAKHLITASYISEEMQSLHTTAFNRDVLLLNEIGLDPGIDHCSALELIDTLKAQKEEIRSFISFCGGLPAPDVEHTPFRYKFSWNPRGVLLAGLNGARYKFNSDLRKVADGDLFGNIFPDIPVSDEFRLEGLANRDSLAYIGPYRLDKTRTFLRGTLRYPGFSSLMDSFKRLGFLNMKEKIYLPNWHSFIRMCIAQQLDTKGDGNATSNAISTLIPSEKIAELHEALEWFELLPTPYTHETPLPPLPAQPMYPLDIFAYLLSKKLAYKPHERDMVVMSHEIVTNDRRTMETKVHTSSLVEYGTPKASAMARTVGFPVAIAALAVLDGKIQLRGVQGPLSKSVYQPVLHELKELGLGMKETTRRMIVIGQRGPVENALAASPHFETIDKIESWALSGHTEVQLP
ncbi:hypothetical protein DXG01_000710 [Tephrocybe rancida]|nr:hypothetical protein DXG01_000710 [Tephrocybe rancida]